jgi:hypothetical protein
MGKATKSNRGKLETRARGSVQRLKQRDFLVLAAHHDLECIVRQRPLQRPRIGLDFVPRSPLKFRQMPAMRAAADLR